MNNPLFTHQGQSLIHADADAQSTTDFTIRQAAAGRAADVKHTSWLVQDGKVVLPRSYEELDTLIREAQ